MLLQQVPSGFHNSVSYELFLNFVHEGGTEVSEL